MVFRYLLRSLTGLDDTYLVGRDLFGGTGRQVHLNPQGRAVDDVLTVPDSTVFWIARICESWLRFNKPR